MSLKTFRSVLAAASLTVLAACASASSDKGAVYDPLEPMNRYTFAFNDMADTIFVRPLAEIYHFGMPDPVEEGISNLLDNLQSPLVALNLLLQGEVSQAGETLGRTVVNTTVGIGGLVDAGSRMGLQKYDADLGQTFGKWGVPSGPYLVLPGFGPSNFRDALGLAGEMVIDPVNYSIRHVGNVRHPKTWIMARGVAKVLDVRVSLLNTLDDMKRNSFDYYSAMRSAYSQRRNSLILGKTAPGSTPDIPSVGKKR